MCFQILVVLGLAKKNNNKTTNNNNNIGPWPFKKKKLADIDWAW